MHGARSGHGIHDVSYELALLLEWHQRKCEPFGAICLDKRKFFDLLEWEIGDGIMKALGAHSGVLHAERQFRAQAVDHFKAGQAVSKASSRTNSYVQGDSCSVRWCWPQWPFGLTPWLRLMLPRVASETIPIFVPMGSILCRMSRQMLCRGFSGVAVSCGGSKCPVSLITSQGALPIPEDQGNHCQYCFGQNVARVP